MSTSRTHRCVDCHQVVEHTPDQLCPSCGRCSDHCQEGDHRKMSRVEFRSEGEGDAARMVPIPPAQLPALTAGSSRRSRDA